jgi:hypothetical protein
VRNRLYACSIVVTVMFGVISAVAAAAQSGGDQFSSQSAAAAAKYFGTWSGTWDGAGSGGFELTLEKATDGKPSGKVSVTGEPTYKATLKKLSFDGQKMTGLYDFPPDDRLEIALNATFEGDSAKGTWTARTKENGTEMMSGGWTVKKK